MSPLLPIDTRSSSLVIRELITRLRVEDVMSRTVLTATRGTTLRAIQHLMKEKGVTGIPIVEQKRLFGMVSVDDIIRALDEGHIDAAAEQHMTRALVTLEEHLPLSLAIAAFEKHPFGRFPVINREGLLAGVLSSRDILTGLLLAINAEVDRLEELIPGTGIDTDTAFMAEYPVKRYDMDNTGKASVAVKKACARRGIDPHTCRRIAVSAYELEMNLALHSSGGVLTCSLTPDSFRVVSRDSGPGIADVDLAVQEGYTTARDWIKSLGFGAGMGLSNVKRVSDSFHITSAPGHGTVVTATILLHPQSPAQE